MTSLATIDEVVNTVQVPVLVTVPVTRTSTETLFGTSCASASVSYSQQSRSNTPSASSSEPPPPTSAPNPPTPSQNNNANNDDYSVSVYLSEYTPPPSVIVSKILTTLPGGQVSESLFVTTSQPPASYSLIPTIVPKMQEDDQKSGPSNVGAVIGGSVGGFFGLIAIVLAIWFFIRRKKRWDDVFEDDLIDTGSRKGRRFSLDVEEEEPKPYQYGLVGHVTPPPAADPPTPSTTGMAQDPFRPLNTAGVATSIRMSSHSSYQHSRPSTAGSTTALRPNQSPTPSAHSPASSITRPAMQHAQHTDYFASVDRDEIDRAGSPTSFREPRRLQVANGTRSPTTSVYSLPEEQVISARRQSGLVPISPPSTTTTS